MATDLSYSNYISLFPEFGSKNQSEVEAEIKRSRLQSNDYKGVLNEDQREYAVFLLVSHNLTLRDRAVSSTQPFADRGLKKISSRYDSVEFSEESQGFKQGSTIYGQQLQQLLEGVLTDHLLF